MTAVRRAILGFAFPVLASALALPAAAQAQATPAGAPVPATSGRLRGQVRTPDLRSVPAATVVAVRQQAPPALVLTSTDANGMLAVNGVPGGTWDLFVSAPGFAPGAVDALTIGGPFRAVADLTLKTGDAPAAPLRLPPGPAAESRFRVIGDQEQPLAGARVQFTPIGHRADPVLVETDAQGVARAPALAPGRWRLLVSRSGWTRLAVPAIDVAGGLEVLARMLPSGEGNTTAIEELLPPPRLVHPAPPAPAPVR